MVLILIYLKNVLSFYAFIFSVVFIPILFDATAIYHGWDCGWNETLAWLCSLIATSLLV